MMWYGWGVGNWLVMSAAVLILSMLVVAGVIWLGRSRQAPTSRAHAARHLPEESLASGEFCETDEEEYRHGHRHHVHHAQQ